MMEKKGKKHGCPVLGMRGRIRRRCRNGGMYNFYTNMFENLDEMGGYQGNKSIFPNLPQGEAKNLRVTDKDKNINK